MKTEISKTLEMNKMISAIITTLGIILIIFMVTVEGELGLLPLLLVIGGSTWFLITNYFIKSKSRKHIDS
ncbi:MAG: hypothetical protein DI539_23210 [Flavobacterium psychrophilum]|nr:MAG: hypothetical protein DI539_23210 [Flavobacterium psychrophilum]